VPKYRNAAIKGRPKNPDCLRVNKFAIVNRRERRLIGQKFQNFV